MTEADFLQALEAINQSIQQGAQPVSTACALSLWDCAITVLPATAPVIILVSAAIALAGVFTSWNVATKRGTLDLIETYETSGKIHRGVQVLREVRERRRDVGTLVRGQPGFDPAARATVIDFLNHHELVAIGLRTGALSESFYKRWMRTNLVSDWRQAADFVQRDRFSYQPETGEWLYDGQIFVEFEKLAHRWAKGDEAGPWLSERSPPFGQLGLMVPQPSARPSAKPAPSRRPARGPRIQPRRRRWMHRGWVSGG